MMEAAMGMSNVRSQKQKASWYCICDPGFVRRRCTRLCKRRGVLASNLI